MIMRTVRRRLSAVAAAAALLAACNTFRTGPVPGTDENALVRVPIGETVTLDEERLAVYFARVLEDSRCPAAAQCVTAGNATVGLVLQERGESTRMVELHTNRRPRAVRHEGYAVELVDLQPLPTASVPQPEDYVVTLRVRRG